MKKVANLISSAALLFLMAAVVAAQIPDTDWYNNNPNATSFTISTADELAGLAAIVNGTTNVIEGRYIFSGKTITLNKNIDLSVYDNWVPIWIFAGTFKGNGHVISNLFINNPDKDYQGLFGGIYGGRVENLGLDNVNIIGKNGVGSIAAAILDNGTVTDCYSIGVVSGNYDVGGVVGAVFDNSYLTNSYFIGSVSAIYDGVGGVVGSVLVESVISNSYSAGTVSSTGKDVGGVVGAVNEFSYVFNSYSIITAIGSENVGGVAGYVNNNSIISNCYSAGAVRASGFGRSSGGVVGYVRGSSVINCAALNPEVRGRAGCGRIIDFISSEYILSNNVAYAEMLNYGGGTGWPNKGTDNRDGEDITIAQVLADGTIGGRFITENGWTVANGSLPGLFGNTVPLPEHLGGTFVKYSFRQSQTAPVQLISISNRTLNLRLTNVGKVDIYALNGAKLHSLDFAQGSHTHRLNDLPRGMYVVRATSGAWKQSVRMVVK